VSPIPSRHPSRITSAQQKTQASSRRPVGGLLVQGHDGLFGTYGRASPKNATFGKNLWEGGWTGSWSALQGLASTVLGGEVGEDTGTTVGAPPGKKRGNARRDRRWSNSGNKAPATWGPSGDLIKGDESIGAGSATLRDSAVKARKMASVLESHEGANGGLDMHGNHKRRTSSDYLDIPREQNEEEDALVYVHHVQPQDTLAGVVLKYNCEPTVFRKANRFWPNDSIQTRKVVLLPVDACAVKGRPCGPPENYQPIDLLAPTPEVEDPPSSIAIHANGDAWAQNRHISQDPFSISDENTDTDQSKTEKEEQTWVHVRWVLLDSSPSSKPVELARLPRKTLGYFPPRRRKSQHNNSSVSTPRASSDINNLIRTSQDLSGSASPSPARRTSNLGIRPTVESYFPAPRSNPRSRSESASESAVPPKWLRGPGGVGTLSKDVRSPGPADDGLNLWAAKHIPSLAIGYLPSNSASASDTVSYGFSDELASIVEGSPFFPTAVGSGTVTPSGQGVNLGLENAASAIEGWLRRFATKAAPGTPKLGGSKAPPALGEGDLIELLDGAGSDDGRGFEPTVVSSSTSGAGSGRQDLAAVRRSQMKGKGKSE
jgi:hypothetical protein